jgi:hypothetical protein
MNPPYFGFSILDFGLPDFNEAIRLSAVYRHQPE